MSLGRVSPNVPDQTLLKSQQTSKTSTFVFPSPKEVRKLTPPKTKEVSGGRLAKAGANLAKGLKTTAKYGAMGLGVAASIPLSAGLFALAIGATISFQYLTAGGFNMHGPKNNPFELHRMLAGSAKFALYPVALAIGQRQALEKFIPQGFTKTI